MNVGFVGLGAMGLPMTMNLLAKGHTVTVASRSRGPIEAAVNAGAADGGDPSGVVAASVVSIICVPDSPDVASVVEKMLPVLAPGKIVVDCSTIDPEVERRQHARVTATGAQYLEAPISGGTLGAQRGTLTLMVGGEARTLEAARPGLEAFSALMVHVGGPGTGQVVKLCNQLIYAAQMLGTAEAFTLAAKSGVDLAKLHEVLIHSTGDCTAVRTRVPFEGVVPDSPASTGWKPGFMTDLMAKDMEIALDCAHRVGVPVPTTALCHRVLVAASEAGYGREDFSALGKLVRKEAGLP
ncbi:MAG: NAD(P)-dependent oxidoreductase [Actinomycetota bacterium]